jgi:ubiquinol-cytochrome c reductase cytochrome c subunit
VRRYVLAGQVGAVAVAAVAFVLVGTQPAAPMPTSPAQKGEGDGATVYAAECSGCHGDEGEGALEGPSVRAIPADPDVVEGVVEIVRDGFGEMDPFGDELSDAEIRAVAEYVVSEFGTEGNAAEGGVLYRLNCAGCHGAPARGGALVYSDVNAPSLMDVPPAKNVSATRAGPDEMPAFNQRALSDQQLASVVEYVEALKDPPEEGGLDLRYPGPVSEGFIALAVGLGVAVLGGWYVERGGRG